jgi:outer membrane protein
LSINNKSFAEIDFTYFFNKNVATELVLTAPQKQRVYSNGSDIGSFKHLPPTLMLQYHFTDMQGFKPYVGAGINYTRFYDVDLGGGTLTVDKTSTGAAIQAGFDYRLSGQWYLNIDVKKIWIETDVKTTAGALVSSLKIDPLLFGVGVGYKF